MKRSNAYPDGVIKDVSVQMNELVFPTDFYVLDMEDDNSPSKSPILLSDVHYVYQLDGIDDCVDEFIDLGEDDPLNMELYHNVQKEKITNPSTLCSLSDGLKETVMEFHKLPSKVKGMKLRTRNCLFPTQSFFLL
ncbi:hypothetical protein GH714_019042 [Hevea brasiliensis]|uniref:Uncharacterized protein n=1 Tax=Hevea brasiliensis TaxID=3981 RepID=A0A6A6KEL9_HEVBR|nr:hypothetical protein GH714_019042 [Hevea brasiliensis]